KMSSAISNFPAQALLRRCETMRKSRIEAAKTRERIVTAAAAEFRQHGIAATGLADLMKAAGLTHGGFYRHFASKDQLVAEVARPRSPRWPREWPPALHESGS